MKKRRATLLMICLGLFIGISSSQTVHAEESMQYNLNNQNYERWATPVNDYLVKCSNGQYMSLQGTDEGIHVQYYDSSFQVVSSRSITRELPIFGAFYEDENNYYILSGQSNPNESDDVEVYRITKYDKSWKRLGSVGLYGANTTVPFDAGSARIDSFGDFLAIRTCHEMYTSSDGLNHQANVTILVNKQNMTITDSYYDVMNSGYGYVSHSFNQFIRIDNGVILGMDHGDAHPRSVYLAKYADDITDGKLHTDAYYDNYWDDSTGSGSNWTGPYWATGVSYLDAYQIQEAKTTHYNNTGVSVGGFEFSESNYLIAGNSVPQDENWEHKKTRNIFISAVNKTTGNVSINWITNYAEGESSASTPHLVKLGNNSFMVLWYRDGLVHYTKLDGSGKVTGKIYQTEGYLSECQPIVADGKLIWYVCDFSGKVQFHKINLSDMTASSLEVPKNKKIVNTVSGIHVYWENVTGASHYQLYRSTSPQGSYIMIKDKISDSHYMDQTVESGKTYYYKVKACNGTSSSSFSAVQGKTFVATPDITSRSNSRYGIKLGWNRIQGATGYAIYRKTDGGEWDRVITISGNNTFTWMDTSVKAKNGTVYKYTVRALAGSSKNILSGCRTTGRTMVRLTSREVTSAVQASKTSIKCKWTTSAAVSGYEIRFMTDGKVVKQQMIGNYVTGVKTFTGLINGKTYEVQIRSYKKTDVGTYYSAWSVKKSVTLK